MKVLLIGIGNISERYKKILKLRKIKFISISSKLVNQFFLNNTDFAKSSINKIIICNKTFDHLKILKNINKFRFKGEILIEKPLFGSKENYKPKNYKKIFVGYNLRLLPIIIDLKKRLKNKKILSVICYTGQNLKLWRKNVNYKNSYSSKRHEGGGVLRDLSHELNYLIYLFGNLKLIKSIINQHSAKALKISSDAERLIIFKNKNTLINLSLNYIDNKVQRFIIINTINKTFYADLFENKLYENKKLFKFKTGIEHTYIKQIQYFIEKKNHNKLITFNEGKKIDNLISLIESKTKKL